MPKSLSTLWLKSIRRIGKIQQAQGRRLFLSLLPKAAKKPARRSPKATPSLKLTTLLKPASVLKLVSAALPAVVKTRRSSVTRKPRLVAASGLAGSIEPLGTWKKAFFSVPASDRFPPARRMLYWLYLPYVAPLDAGTPAQPMPLVVMVHGCEQSATDFATATHMNELAERKGFAVLYPQQSVDADPHRCWHWYKRPTQAGLGDVQLIAQMIAKIQVKHGLDTSRTYIAGLSAGAGLANILALRHPNLIAAAGLHSAPVYGTTDSPLSAYGAMQHGSTMAHGNTAQAFVNESTAFPGMPVILIHGDSDTVVRTVNVQQLAHQFSIINSALINGTDPVRRKYAARSNGTSPRRAYKTTTYYAGRKPQLVKCEISGMGHAWSGGDPTVKYTEPRGPNASLMMWTFFTKHQRPQLMGSLPVVEDEAA